MDASILAEQGLALTALPPTVGSQHSTGADSSPPITEVANRSDEHAASGSSHVEGSFNGSESTEYQYARGWPLMARIQQHYHNASIHRRFDVAAHRVLIDMQTKVWYLVHELGRLDERDEKEDIMRLRTLGFNLEDLMNYCADIAHSGTSPHPPGDHESQGPDKGSIQDPSRQAQYDPKEKNRILELLTQKLKEYYEFMLLFNQIRKLRLVSERGKDNLLEIFKSQTLLEGEEPWGFLREGNNDFISPRDAAPFEYMLYRTQDSRIYWLILAFFNWCFGMKRGPQAGESETHLNSRHLKILSRLLWPFPITLLCGLVLVCPVAILFLVSMSDPQSLGVVLCFGTLFIFVLSMARVPVDTILVGFSAYMAVLTTLLSNIQESRAR